MFGIAVVSGGMDSVTLAYKLKREGHDLHLVSFNYGQRHKKEIEFARICARDLGTVHRIVNLPITEHLRGSALTDERVQVPEGHYAADNMSQTVVPNRNAIMLSIAYGIAVANQADFVAAAFHSGDHFIYPDCRPEFTKAFSEMQKLATEGYGKPHLELVTPFINSSKADIASIGSKLGVPWRQTWSCYQGGGVHCGRCGTCVERIEAFHLAEVDDPTYYEDSTYWQSVVDRSFLTFDEIRALC